MSKRTDILSGIPEHNIMIDCQSPHAELLDVSKGTVWQSVLAISREDYAALELPESLVRIGVGRGVMDAHYFRRSPGADSDGPVVEWEVDGRLFIHCANPPKDGPIRAGEVGPQLLRVDKYHTLVFEAGREVAVITTPDGRDYVQVIAAAPEGGSLMQSNEGTAGWEKLSLPDGWRLRSEHLSSLTTIHLPNPTEAWFFSNGASFQGPVEL